MSTPPSSHVFSTEYLEPLAPLLSGSVKAHTPRRIVEEVADTDASVLVHGTNGAGMVAGRVPPDRPPFVVVNRAARPAERAENAGQRVVVLGSEGPVLDEPMEDGLTAIARRAVREAARAALHEVLRRAQGNRAEVARIFKVSDTTLFGQLAECRLPRGGERESTSTAPA